MLESRTRRRQDAGRRVWCHMAVGSSSNRTPTVCPGEEGIARPARHSSCSPGRQLCVLQGWMPLTMPGLCRVHGPGWREGGGGEQIQPGDVHSPRPAPESCLLTGRREGRCREDPVTRSGKARQRRWIVAREACQRCTGRCLQGRAGVSLGAWCCGTVCTNGPTATKLGPLCPVMPVLLFSVHPLWDHSHPTPVRRKTRSAVGDTQSTADSQPEAPPGVLLSLPPGEAGAEQVFLRPRHHPARSRAPPATHRATVAACAPARRPARGRAHPSTWRAQALPAGPAGACRWRRRGPALVSVGCRGGAWQWMYQWEHLL